MDRRAFLRFLSGTAAGAAIAPTLDLDRLLWVPGAKRIFLPPSIMSGDWISREALAILENNLTLTCHLNRRYDSVWCDSGAKIGDTLTVRLPRSRERSGWV